MTLSKFLTYWSLLFAILTIWGFSVLVALATAKDELLETFRKRWAATRRAPPALPDPLAGRSIAETLTTRPMTASQTWVLEQVKPIAEHLGLRVRTLVLQDSQGHFVVYLAQGKRLVTYRLDKAWVTDAATGNADQLKRIRDGVEQYLRQEFLGQAPAPVTTPAGGPDADATAGATPGAGPGARAAAAPSDAGMSREERIAAARAKAEELRAERAASGAAVPPQPPTDKP